MKFNSMKSLVFTLSSLGLLSSCGETRFASDNAVKSAVELPPSSGEGNPKELNHKAIAEGSESKEVIQEFSVGGLVDRSIKVDVVNSSLEQKFTLKKELVRENFQKNFIQSERPPVEQTFKQGTHGAAIEENFKQDNYGILDLLVVIDNSGSMFEEQKNLSSKLDPLLTFVKDSDWQVAVLTTDPDANKNPCFRSIIKKGDVNVQDAFANAIQAGTSGSGDERGILNAARGVDTCKASWMRPGSSVAVLIVSDEDNCSNGTSCAGQVDAKPKYLIDALNKSRVAGVDAKVYGLINVPGTVCKTAYNVSNVYNQLIKDAKGVAGSICDSDYTTTLKAISKEVALTLKVQFSLKNKPDMNTLEVFVNNVKQDPSAYSLNNQTLKFNMVPPAGADIKVTYVSGATETFSDYKLNYKPYAGSVAVKVNNQNVSNFTIVNDVLKFAAKPADNADIKVSYKRDVALNKTFSIGKNVVSDTISVSVNNAVYSMASYDANKGILELTKAPAEKAIVKVSYTTEKKGNPILGFDFKSPWGTLKDLRAWDASDKSKSISVKYEGGKIVFLAKDFIEGRNVVVSYRDQSVVSRQIPLDREPLEGSFDLYGVDANGDLISCSDNSFIFEENYASTTCDLQDAEYLYATYKYESEFSNSFKIEGIKEPSKAKWTVWLDGVETSNYQVIDGAVEVLDPLYVGAVVKIRVVTNQ